MAHELTIRANGKAEMAFVGETPWHNLGQNVTKGAPLDVWATEAGMNWQALSAIPQFVPEGASIAETSFVPDSKVIYRSDNREPLSIVGKDYNIVQPRDMLEFFRDLTESGGWHIHTAGTMRGGRKLWAMATTEDACKYVKPSAGNKAKYGDGVKLNLLLATSMDGSMRTTAMLTSVRVVCANTLRMAMEGGASAQVQLTHRSSFDAQYIKAVLGVDAAHKHFDVFMEQARQLADTPIDLSDARDVLLQIFKPSASAVKTNLNWLTANIAQLDTQAEPQDTRSTGRVLELFDGAGMGADLATSRGTRWGLLNAVTQYVDHEMGRTPDTRLDAAWFGRGKDFKQQAFDLLTEEA